MIDPRFYELVKHLWRGGTYAMYWTPDTDEGKLSFWFFADKPREVVDAKFINIYFGVHPSRVERGQRQRALIETIEAVNCLFAEFDLAEGQSPEHLLESVNQLDIPPSVIIFSGGGYHAYWLLEQTYHIDSDEARQRIIDIQYAWDDLVTGDNHVKDLARVLRIPGTYNRKPEYAPNYPQVEIVKFDMDLVYSLDELYTQVESIIATSKAKQATVAQLDTVPVDLDDHTIVEKMRSKDPAADALWAGDISNYNDDHSDADLALCNRLAFWFGRDRARMDRIFRNSGLFRPKWLRDDYRNRTLDKAIADCTATYTPGNNGNLGNPQELIGINPTPVYTNGTGQTNGQAPPQMPQQTNIDDLLLNFSADDWGNAQAVYLLHGQDFIFCSAYEYLHYNGKFWEAESAEPLLIQSIVNALIRRRVIAVQHTADALVKATKPTATNVRNCMYLFKSLIEESIDRFDENPDFLNCKNGVIDLRTGALQPHDANQRFTYCIPVDYDAQADYVEWCNFLHSCVDAPEIVNYLKLAMGYSATGYTKEECMFYIHGPTRSGKGTVGETLLSLLCKPLGVQTDFATFTAKREGDTQNFDLAPLKPARLIIASESDKYDTLNEAKVKTVTGGDWIRCAFKHRDHFEYRPQFKVWLLSNHPIKGDVDDDAFWGRVKIIEFPHSRLGKEDKSLKQRMKSKENLKGVLRWIVEGAVEWFKNPQGLQTPVEVDKANKERRNELDYVQQWIDACCKLNPTEWTANAALYYSYKSWCEGTGIRPKQMEGLSQVLSKKGFRTGVQRRIPNGQRAKGVEGFSIA